MIMEGDEEELGLGGGAREEGNKERGGRKRGLSEEEG